MLRSRLQLVLLFFLAGFVFANPTAALIPEQNLWPLFVGERRHVADEFDHWQGAGPIVFSRENEEGGIRGIRPFYIEFDDAYDRGDFHVLYPVFNYRRRHAGHSWDVLTFLRYDRTHRTSEAAGEDSVVNLRLSPIFFYGHGPRPRDSYFGIFPVYGDVHTIFGQDRFKWIVFPLYGRAEKSERVLTMAPWPFFKIYRGEDAGGVDFWPFYGRRWIEDVYDRRFVLWPFGYSVRRELWKDEPFEAFGVLPFYSRSRSETAESESFIWPFFGYTHSTDPEYREIRYFWPLMVQRRGEYQYTNRIAPFYTRSIRRHRDRQWIVWPFYRHEKTANRGLLEEKTQFFYFLYWSLKQSDPDRPEAAPARKRHLWPLLSHWDDGAGRRQTQVLSPLEVFFQHNRVIRHNYSPLFALYQRDVDETEDRSRHSLLFRMVTWQRRADDYRLNLGPLLTVEKEDGSRGAELLKGLVGYDQEDGFTFLWIDFSRDDDEMDPHQE